MPSFPEKGENVPGRSFNDTKNYSFAGPGTNFIQRLQEGYHGINNLDKAAKTHDWKYIWKYIGNDWKYWKYKDRDSRTRADMILAADALKIANDHSKSGYERAMAAFVYKTFVEGGIADKLQGGKGMTLRKQEPVN